MTNTSSCNITDIHLEYVEWAVRRVLSQDTYLIHNNIYEPAISFRLAHYLTCKFEPAYNVDCEFNRDLKDPKRRLDDGQTTGQRPDIIVHKRGTNDFNLIMIELKKSFDCTISEAERSNIESWMGGNRRYQIGIRIAFDVIEDTVAAEIQIKASSEVWGTPMVIEAKDA